MAMSEFILKSSTELAAAIEAVNGGYSFRNQPNGIILFTCMQREAGRVLAALKRVSPIYIYNA